MHRPGKLDPPPARIVGGKKKFRKGHAENYYYLEFQGFPLEEGGWFSATSIREEYGEALIEEFEHNIKVYGAGDRHLPAAQGQGDMKKEDDASKKSPDAHPRGSWRASSPASSMRPSKRPKLPQSPASSKEELTDLAGNTVLAMGKPETEELRGPCPVSSLEEDAVAVFTNQAPHPGGLPIVVSGTVEVKRSSLRGLAAIEPGAVHQHVKDHPHIVTPELLNSPSRPLPYLALADATTSHPGRAALQATRQTPQPFIFQGQTHQVALAAAGMGPAGEKGMSEISLAEQHASPVHELPLGPTSLVLAQVSPQAHSSRGPVTSTEPDNQDLISRGLLGPCPQLFPFRSVTSPSPLSEESSPPGEPFKRAGKGSQSCGQSLTHAAVRGAWIRPLLLPPTGEQGLGTEIAPRECGGQELRPCPGSPVLRDSVWAPFSPVANPSAGQVLACSQPPQLAVTVATAVPRHQPTLVPHFTGPGVQGGGVRVPSRLVGGLQALFSKKGEACALQQDSTKTQIEATVTTATTATTAPNSQHKLPSHHCPPGGGGDPQGCQEPKPSLGDQGGGRAQQHQEGLQTAHPAKHVAGVRGLTQLADRDAPILVNISDTSSLVGAESGLGGIGQQPLAVTGPPCTERRKPPGIGPEPQSRNIMDLVNPFANARLAGAANSMWEKSIPFSTPCSLQQGLVLGGSPRKGYHIPPAVASCLAANRKPRNTYHLHLLALLPPVQNKVEATERREGAHNGRRPAAGSGQRHITDAGLASGSRNLPRLTETFTAAPTIGKAPPGDKSNGHPGGERENIDLCSGDDVEGKEESSACHCLADTTVEGALLSSPIEHQNKSKSKEEGSNCRQQEDAIAQGLGLRCGSKRPLGQSGRLTSSKAIQQRGAVGGVVSPGPQADSALLGQLRLGFLVLFGKVVLGRPQEANPHEIKLALEHQEHNDNARSERQFEDAKGKVGSLALLPCSPSSVPLAPSERRWEYQRRATRVGPERMLRQEASSNTATTACRGGTQGALRSLDAPQSAEEHSLPGVDVGQGGIALGVPGMRVQDEAGGEDVDPGRDTHIQSGVRPLVAASCLRRQRQVLWSDEDESPLVVTVGHKRACRVKQQRCQAAALTVDGLEDGAGRDHQMGDSGAPLVAYGANGCDEPGPRNPTLAGVSAGTTRGRHCRAWVGVQGPQVAPPPIALGLGGFDRSNSIKKGGGHGAQMEPVSELQGLDQIVNATEREGMNMSAFVERMDAPGGSSDGAAPPATEVLTGLEHASSYPELVLFPHSALHIVMPSNSAALGIQSILDVVAVAHLVEPQFAVYYSPMMLSSHVINITNPPELVVEGPAPGPVPIASLPTKSEASIAGTGALSEACDREGVGVLENIDSGTEHDSLGLGQQSGVPWWLPEPQAGLSFSQPGFFTQPF